MLKDVIVKKVAYIVLFSLLIANYVFSVGAELYSSSLRDALRLLLVAFLFGLSLTGKFKLTYLVTLFISIIILLLLFMVNHSGNAINIIVLSIIVYAMVTISDDGMPLEEVVYKAAMLSALAYVIVHFLGITNNIVLEVGDRVRYFFGFVNPNKFALYVLNVSCITVMYSLSIKRLGWFRLFILILLFILLIYTDSRTSILTFLILVMSTFLAYYRAFTLLKIASISAICLSVVAFWAFLEFHSSLSFNVLLSSRPYEMANAVSGFNESDWLLGTELAGRSDNSHIQIVSGVGLVFYTFFIAFLLYKLVTTEDMRLLVLAPTIMAVSVTEGVLIAVEALFVLVFYSYLFIGGADVKSSNQWGG